MQKNLRGRYVYSGLKSSRYRIAIKDNHSLKLVSISSLNRRSEKAKSALHLQMLIVTNLISNYRSFGPKQFSTTQKTTWCSPTKSLHPYAVGIPEMLQGTIHILRKHMYSTKLNLTYLIDLLGFFLSKQNNLFFNIAFWQNFHAVVWNFYYKYNCSKNLWRCCGW